MRITNKLSIITSTLALSIISLTPVQASTPASGIESSTQQTVTETVVSPIVELRYERPTITTSTAAPLAVETVPQPVSIAVAPKASLPVLATPVAPPATVVQTIPAAPVAPPTAPTSSGRGATIAAAALAQLGVAQDCTALATNSLAAAGIHFHGWPAGYLSLGPVVSASAAQPGDLIYYSNAGAGVPHIAVYIGNGQAVHGGWNGGTTVIASANLGSGGTYIRV